MRIFTSDRQILGHPLYKPQRKTLQGKALRVSPKCNVKLERVHQFVPQHMVGFLVRAGHGHYDSFLERLGHPSCTLADASLNDIGLLKVGIVGVEDERLPVVKLTQERA